MSDIDEESVLQAARRAGLRIDAARLPAVLGNLRRIAALAQPMLEVELTPEDELGPECKP